MVLSGMSVGRRAQCRSEYFKITSLIKKRTYPAVHDASVLLTFKIEHRNEYYCLIHLSSSTACIIEPVLIQINIIAIYTKNILNWEIGKLYAEKTFCSKTG